MNIYIKYAILLAFTLFLLFQPALGQQESDQVPPKLEYKLFQYLLPYFKTQGGIVSMTVDNTQQKDRGTLFIATQNNHLLIYYPNITGYYQINQQILLTNKKDRVCNLEIFNTDAENILLVSFSNGDIVVYRSPQKSNALFKRSSVLSTSQLGNFQTHFYAYDHHQYIFIDKISSNILIYHRLSTESANFSLLQNIDLGNSSKLSSFSFVKQLTTYQKPLLFITVQNKILIYQLIDATFQQRNQVLTLSKSSQNQTEYQTEEDSLNIFETVIFTHQHTRSIKQDFLITTTSSSLTLFALIYENNQLASSLIQQITILDRKNEGMIQRVEPTEDGYIALLLSNNSVQVYGESSENRFQKKTEFLPQLKRKPHYQYLSIEFSDNHHQLVVNLFPQQLNIYLSNDTPIYSQDENLFKILIPISVFVFVFILAVLIVCCCFRYDFRSRIIPFSDKMKATLSESRKHFPITEDFSRDELYDIKTTNIINDKGEEEEESAYEIESSDNSQIIHWKPEEQILRDQQIIQ